MYAVILAGGKGTRLGNITNYAPKPLVKIGETPILEHQINLLKKSGIKKIFLCVHYLSNKIIEYFGDGSKWGIKIYYSKEDNPLGTAGCLKELETELTDSFLVLYGDIMMEMDLQRLLEFHKRNNSIATLVVHPTNHPYDSDLIEVDSKYKITGFLSKPHQDRLIYRNLASAGVYVLSPMVFKYIKRGIKSDFGKNVFPIILNKKRNMFAYNTPEYLADMGTPERLKKVNNDFINGKIHSSNLRDKRPAIFLDRDGVINKEVDQLCKLNDFELLPKVSDAIKMINESKYLAVVITNQPAVAKGMCDITDIENIHKKMETILGRRGVKLDAIYYCPHHQDRGYPQENSKYKIECNCRKPKIGMIKQAKKELNLDLSKSFIIGDSTRDILAGKNAGIKTIGVRTGYACKDGKYSVEPDYMFDDLYDAVEGILRGLR